MGGCSLFFGGIGANGTNNLLFLFFFFFFPSHESDAVHAALQSTPQTARLHKSTLAVVRAGKKPEKARCDDTTQVRGRTHLLSLFVVRGFNFERGMGDKY